MRAHDWFVDTDWDKLLACEVSPPFRPCPCSPNSPDGRAAVAAALASAAPNNVSASDVAAASGSGGSGGSHTGASYRRPSSCCPSSSVSGGPGPGAATEGGGGGAHIEPDSPVVLALTSNFDPCFTDRSIHSHPGSSSNDHESPSAKGGDTRETADANGGAGGGRQAGDATAKSTYTDASADDRKGKHWSSSLPPVPEPSGNFHFLGFSFSFCAGTNPDDPEVCTPLSFVAQPRASPHACLSTRAWVYHLPSIANTEISPACFLLRVACPPSVLHTNLIGVARCITRA